jgi:hypothetical protein
MKKGAGSIEILLHPTTTTICALTKRVRMERGSSGDASSEA